MTGFENKVILITGSADGIGKSMAERFAELGSNLLMSDLNENINLIADEISKKYSVKAVGFKHDVSVEEECINAVKKAMDEFGRIDVLVNNAGITRDNLVLRMKEKDFDDVISVNLKGPFLMSKNVFIYMSKQRYGRIINIASVVGQSGQAGQANYSASKAGLIGLTKSLAREFARRNVTVNAIAPGFIQTKMTDKLDEKSKQQIISQIPLERLGLPRDVADAAVFLASDSASYITGQVIGVNGGLYM
ncbi:MAG: 3-oxoacyl-[acyl-carrier-protein] reductase [Elusimicrobiales bacterium]|jgi:3-oxoacyl-[acyl-carrier protein] reductase|nr:3-oxoacyl-[acyl-carrier-protein] reductase [Elusimicrobiales bacterium]NLH39723.1 3-oxoacyl-[acyl-carrier-protein] reductase [Elusimicrobiota bacterium]